MERWTDEELDGLFGNVGCFDPGEELGSGLVIEEVLGKGSQGEAYKVRNQHDGNLYVAKVYVDDEDNQRVSYELKVFRRLSKLPAHHHIVHAHPATGAGDRTILVLEYVDGQSLSEYIAQNAPCSPRQAIALVRQILDGVGFLHANGIIHRDVKPDNVKLAEKGKRAVVFDFSIAALKDDASPITHYAGTPGFSPPDKEVTPAWDVFSVGVVLHQLLTGRPPTWERGGSSPENCEDRLVMPPELAFRPAVSCILRKALFLDRNRRFANAHAFRNALSLPRVPCYCLPALPSWCCRNPVPVVIAGAALIAVALPMGAHIVLSDREHRSTAANFRDKINNLQEEADYYRGELKRYEADDARAKWHDFEQEKLAGYGLNMEKSLEQLDKATKWLDARTYPPNGKSRVHFLELVEGRKEKIREMREQRGTCLTVEFNSIELIVPDDEDKAHSYVVELDINNEECSLELKPRKDKKNAYISEFAKELHSCSTTRSLVRVTLRRKKPWRPWSRKVTEWDAKLADLQPGETDQGRVELPGLKGYSMKFSGKLRMSE